MSFVVPATPNTGPVHLAIEDEENGAYNSVAILYVSGNSSPATGHPAAGVLRRRPSSLGIRGIRASALVHKRGRQFDHDFH